MAEVGAAAVAVRQGGVVHHLQEHAEEVRVGLLQLVEQQHRMGLLAHGVREQAALLVAHITWRGADEAGHGVLLLVLTHVEAQEGDAQGLRELLGQLRLAHAGGSREQEAAHGLQGIPQARPRQLDGACHRLAGRVLAEDLGPQRGLEARQGLAVVGAD